METNASVRSRTLLRWLGIPYELAARFRRWGYERGWFRTQRLPRPVISVGNLTMGGTGKTPMVMHLVERLTVQGKRVAVLSRGYRRRSRSRQLLVSDGLRVLAGPEEAGDEPYLIARRCPHAVVAVGADRYALGQWVLSRLPVDCFLLDDGFQHVQLHRDVDLLLIDATDLAG
ncbi:MAG: tetraacyldisaccharide 4'-kinase, partial [Nitrospirota bacterium]|nr:tetraacyldisaccharide 4'-kinase [Nitrospirota bacterium]